jgi:murein L,D-transpeptidase YafK
LVFIDLKEITNIFSMFNLCCGKKWARLILQAAAIFVILVLCFILTLVAQPRLPQAAMIMYLELNSQARKIDAGIYVAPMVQQAHNYWEKSRQMIGTENKRFPLFRHYENAEKLILKTNEDLRQAIRRTQVLKDSLRLALKLKMFYLQDQAEQNRVQFEIIPIAFELREHIIHGELLVRHGGYLLERKDYSAADSILQKAEEHISYANSNLAEEINRYLSKIPTWQQWVKETLDYAQNTGNTAVIIDKLDHACRVFQADTLLFEFAIEMSPYWIGTKTHKGDRRTPEGRYYVTKRRQGKETQFYKAFNIDYPNETDWLRFYSALVNGDLPLDANIGGLIEIHGEGGQGLNWTDGCIALRNQDIDKIFAMIQVGTPVTIVGTTKNYQINFNHSNNHLN